MQTTQFKNVLFTPYIGEKYLQGYQGKKVLVLGESHYSADENGNASLDDPILNLQKLFIMATSLLMK